MAAENLASRINELLHQVEGDLAASATRGSMTASLPHHLGTSSNANHHNGAGPPAGAAGTLSTVQRESAYQYPFAIETAVNGVKAAAAAQAHSFTPALQPANQRSSATASLPQSDPTVANAAHTHPYYSPLAATAASQGSSAAPTTTSAADPASIAHAAGSAGNIAGQLLISVLEQRQAQASHMQRHNTTNSLSGRSRYGGQELAYTLNLLTATLELLKQIMAEPLADMDLSSLVPVLQHHASTMGRPLTAEQAAYAALPQHGHAAGLLLNALGPQNQAPAPVPQTTSVSDDIRLALLGAINRQQVSAPTAATLAGLPLSALAAAVSGNMHDPSNSAAAGNMSLLLQQNPILAALQNPTLNAHTANFAPAGAINAPAPMDVVAALLPVLAAQQQQQQQSSAAAAAAAAAATGLPPALLHSLLAGGMAPPAPANSAAALLGLSGVAGLVAPSPTAPGTTPEVDAGRSAAPGARASVPSELHTSSLNKTPAVYSPEPFPEKLYRLLTEMEAEKMDSVVSFVANGTAFKIHQPVVFEREVSPRYFRQSKIRSFKRQLNNYAFRRIYDQGPNEGAYAHPYFQKGRADLLNRVRRVKSAAGYGGKGAGAAAAPASARHAGGASVESGPETAATLLTEAAAGTTTAHDVSGTSAESPAPADTSEVESTQGVTSV